MNILGIDIGITNTKVVECDSNLEIISKHIIKEKDVEKILNKFDTSNIDKVVITGVGANGICPSKRINNIPIIKEEEFVSSAKGGLFLANKTEAVIINMGTGTSFIEAGRNGIKHLGGTGVGGRNIRRTLPTLFKYELI